MDLGCGSGAFTNFIARAVGKKGRVYAVDIQPDMLKQLEHKLSKKGNESIKNIKLIIANANKLPFENEQFELIINRHESYSPAELHRILKSDGLFITQQVGWKDNLEINQRLGYPVEELEYLDWDLKKIVNELEDVGFNIIKKLEAFPITRCFDVGAIVYYLKAIPWQIPEFSVEKYEKNLWDMHLEILEEGYIDLTSHRILILSEKK